MAVLVLYFANDSSAYSPHRFLTFERFLVTPLKIDVLVFYTPEAMAGVSITSPSAMETVIKSYFAEANLGNDHSQILLEYNVVHVTEVRTFQPKQRPSTLRSGGGAFVF